MLSMSDASIKPRYLVVLKSIFAGIGVGSPASSYTYPIHVSFPAVVWSPGMGIKVMMTLSFTAGQGPAGLFVVAVNVTLPLARSLAPGVYIASGSVLLLNEPSPEVVHVMEAAAPPRVASSCTVLPKHMFWVGPASTVAAGFMVIMTLSVNPAQLPVAVAVRVTVPAEMSLDPGVYLASGSVLSSKEPLPEVDHSKPVAEPPNDALNIANPEEQIV